MRWAFSAKMDLETSQTSPNWNWNQLKNIQKSGNCLIKTGKLVFMAPKEGKNRKNPVS
jgi:hypothetical protein